MTESEEIEDVDSDEHTFEQYDRVLSPDGYGVVLKTQDQVALIDLIRPTTRNVERFEFDDLEHVDDEEWIVYEHGPTETPHK